MRLTEDTVALLAGLMPPRMPTSVYPLYMASRAKQGLIAALNDRDQIEQIIATVGDVQSLGNSRYAIPLTDANGTRYRITVEVVS